MKPQDILTLVSGLASGLAGGRPAAVPGVAPRVAVRVDAACPREVVGWVRCALTPDREGVLVDVAPAAGEGASRTRPGTAAAVVLGCGRDALACARRLAVSGLPCCLVADGRVDRRLADGGALRVVAARDERSTLHQLASWLAAVSDDARLAEPFAFSRDAAGARLVSDCATRNVLVGAVGLIPGSQMPVMTANELSLALELGRLRGREEPASLAPQLAGVVVAGFALRGLSRALTRALPWAGFPVRCLVALGGTYAVGRAVDASLSACAGEGPEGARDPVPGVPVVRSL